MTCIVLAGCLNQIRDPYIDALESAVRAHDDPELVADAMPAYLVAVDAGIEASPDDQTLLSAGARLYALQSLVFVDAQDRRQRLARRSVGYAERSLCATLDRKACQLLGNTREPISAELFQQAPVMDWYRYAVSVTALLDASRGSTDGLLMLPRLNNLFDQLVAAAPGLDYGNLHLYYGLVLSLQPVPAAQTEAEVQLHHAVEAADGRNLLARLVREERLQQQADEGTLQDIIDANPVAEGLTLQNRIAQQWAAERLSGSKD